MNPRELGSLVRLDPREVWPSTSAAPPESRGVQQPATDRVAEGTSSDWESEREFQAPSEAHRPSDDTNRSQGCRAKFSPFLAGQLERLRGKLLDLTARNPLLSFKHSGRSRRFIRVVDELPNQLFESLETDAAIRFRSLGPEDNEPLDEKTIVFRRAVDAAKLQDPEYIQKIKDLGDDPGDKSLQRAETELRVRLRERIGMPPRRATQGLTAHEVAVQRQLNPSFDLPLSAVAGCSGATPKHTDLSIQTLLFDGAMERTLSGLREQMRLSIEESGVNPMFMVFGFLEWYESKESDVKMDAPLLLYPVHMERELVRGSYQYSVRSAGEGAMGNAALTERLKRDFEIALPQVDDETTPDRYFAAVREAVSKLEGWKVRRFVTVGLFRFARIAMWHDLDPNNWSSEGGVGGHETISRLFDSDNGAARGEEPAVEDSVGGEVEAAAPVTIRDELEFPLVSDTDSSQLEAIRDVVNGKSLVIEGPPGTGKSQTITNIIAAAIATGKSVLFVAEKMAALNVVRSRLEQAGLHEFCLDLHSTKAGRREVAAKLASRIDYRPPHDPSQHIQSTLRNLKDARDAIRRFVEALAKPAGALGVSVQELLWRLHLVRKETADLGDALDEIDLPGAALFTDVDLGRIVDVGERFARARGALTAKYGAAGDNPWSGFVRTPIDPVRAEEAFRHVRRIAQASSRLAAVGERVRSLTGWSPRRVDDFRRLAAFAGSPPPGPEADDDLIARLVTPETMTMLLEFAGLVEAHEAATRRCRSAFAAADAADRCRAEKVASVCSAIVREELAGGDVQSLGSVTANRKAEADRWERCAKLIARIAAAVGAAPTASIDDERRVLTVVDLAGEIDGETLSSRFGDLMRSGATAAIEKLARRKSAILEERDALTARFALDSDIDSAELRRHATTLRAGGVFRLLSAGWRSARRSHRALELRRTKADGASMSADLERIAAFQSSVQAFEADGSLTRWCGDAAQGLNTGFIACARVACWGDRVRARLNDLGKESQYLVSFLMNGSADDIEQVARLASDPAYDDLRVVIDDAAATGKSVARRAAELRESSERTQRLAADILSVGLRPDYSLGDLDVLAKAAAEREDAENRIAAGSAPQSVLGPRFDGVRTAVAPIRASAAYVFAVGLTEMASELRSWILKTSATTCSASLRELAAGAQEGLSDLDGAYSRLTECVPVDFATWLGVSNALDSSVEDLRDHGARCSADPDGLQLLVDDVRMMSDATDEGLAAIISALAPIGGLPRIGAACRRVALQSIVRAVIVGDPALANFTGEVHEGHRQQFRSLDRKLSSLRQQKIAFDLSRRIRDRGSDKGPRGEWTGMMLVRNEALKQKRHVPIRDLLNRAGQSIQQLMPCFMMSPLSVAQYLQPGGLTFDIVIMDEASQLRPEDAVGAIRRGRQVVIVGDPKQLPPTNFFMSAEDQFDDEGPATAADEQSILDVALGVLRPARRLKWHYRSRDASLIAFSNEEFYDNQLVVFPAPYHAHADFGVSYERVEGGCYRSGVNPPEAQFVARRVLEYVGRQPDRSLGVVTLNSRQAEVLTLEIDRLEAEDAVFHEWRMKRETSLEPFFVKNLENVQGDERDTIFISTVYGKDEAGNFYQRFGPITMDGGHRRLNVLFTRAKFQTVVFSSMDPGDIRTSETSSRGLHALKGFLNFARDGVLSSAQETGRPADSAFEVSVAEVLRDAGYEVEVQVGVVGYFIDMAVRHPHKKGEFVLGIECDGATYHSTKSARDRDRLRQENLERLKWRIHRIWSLDWFRHPKRQSERLLTAVRQAIAAST